MPVFLFLHQSHALDVTDFALNKDTSKLTAKKTLHSVPKPDIEKTVSTKRKRRRKTIIAVEHENVQPETMTGKDATEA